MSTSGPLGPGGNPFESLGGLFGDLAKMLQSQGPLNWDAARSFALQLATGGAPEPNPDPVERIELERLARVAEMRVADATGLAPSTTGRPVTVVPVTRAEWARRALDAYRPLLERLSGSLAPAPPPPGTDPGDPADPGDPMAGMLGGLFTMMGPVLLGMQAGSMVGHLASRAFGQYDLPLPRPADDELVVVSANVAAFGEEWSLPADDLRLWVCLSELTTHAVLGVPAVRARLEELVSSWVGGFSADAGALEERIGRVDLNDLSSLQDAFGDPAAVLGAITSPEQEALRPRLEAVVAVVVGYVDHIVESVGSSLLGSYGMVTEALRRRRVEASEADRFVERLFGLELGRAQYERGEAFVRGVVERAGPEALARLWASERSLPTPPEVDAPGLWLARIDLPE